MEQMNFSKEICKIENDNFGEIFEDAIENFVGEDAVNIRRSSRTTNGISPDRYEGACFTTLDLYEPSG